MTAVAVSWRELEKRPARSLLDAVSEGRVEVGDRRRWCRAILKDKFDDSGNLKVEMELLSLNSADEEEILAVRGIVDPRTQGD